MRGRTSLYPARTFELHLRQVEMSSPIKRVAIENYLCCADVADIYNVEVAVAELRFGSYFHPAAEISGICDTEVDSIQRNCIAVVYLHFYSGVIKSHDLLKCGYC